MADNVLLAAPPFPPANSPAGKSAVTLTPHRSMASIAAFKDGLPDLRDRCGLALPGVGQSARDADILYLWAGLESWLAVADFHDPNFDLKLAERCHGLAAVTDQSDGRSILRIAGPAAREALAKLLPIDLHPSAFPPNATAMTLAGHIPVQIWHAGDVCFELACFRSFAETLYEALIEASTF